MNKMDPKARECFYLGPAKNHPRESKRVFVHTGKVIITRNVTWAHVRSGRFLITRSKPSVVGEGDESGQDREASSANSESASEDGGSVSEGTGSEVETPEAEAAAPITSGRASTPTPRARGSQCGVSIDPERVMPGESLADTPAAASTSHGPDKRYTALGAGEAKRLAEYIPGPSRFSLRGRTRGEERRLTTDAQGLWSLEDELEIAQAVEEETMLEEAYVADAGVSIEMPTGKIQDLPPPPTTQAELLRSPFRKAFELSQRVEIEGLLDVGCFAPVDGEKIPKGRKIVASKWVHTYKGDEKGYCVKTKSRLVAKGFSQVAGVDYNETTSPTPAAAPVKMIAAVANENGLPVHHLDVSQAFVQAPLKEDIFMRLPPGCGELSGKIERLLKCQYGLKQAGREWHMLLVNWLVEEIGLEQWKAEPCVFRLMVKDEVSLMVGVHVDDIIVSGGKNACDKFFAKLKERFPVKNQGELKMYTGCAFVRDWESGVLEMNQTAYAENLVAQYGISATSNIPGSPGVDLGPRKDGEQGGNDEFPLYRPLVGSLMWLSVMTRPDIANALRACARHSHNPSPRHWKALLQVAAYVNATKEMGLRFVRGSGLRLSVYADADYAAVSNDRRSVSGVAVMLGDTAIGWKSSTQRCVTTATCEAEYVALCDASKEALFTRAVLVFLQPELSGMRVDIFGDNEGAKAIADNPSSASRSKHIDVKLHFIRGLVRAGEVRILHVGTAEQHADVLTKPLWRKKFMLHRAALMNLS